MATRSKLKYGRLALAATCLALITTRAGGWQQAPTLDITLTGQSMIRSDIRATAPSAVTAIAPLLKGDVIFTNFEGTVAESGQPNESTPLQDESEGIFLAPPG